MTRGHRRASPAGLWRSALLGFRAAPMWALLVASAFAVLAAAGAAPTMFAEASDNRAWTDVVAAVPGSARAADSPVVRLTGSLSPRRRDQQPFLDELAGIPGLSRPALTGSSVGFELSRGAPWSSTVALADPPAGSAAGRPPAVGARLMAVDAPARSLVPTTGGGAGRSGAARAAGGLWLPAPVARELGAAAGDPVRVTVTRTSARSSVLAVAGIYQVAEDGRLPADPPGQRGWAQRRGELPDDTDLKTLKSYLLVTDVPTATTLARTVRDQLLWTAESRLTSDLTLAEAREVAAAVDLLRGRYVPSPGTAGGASPIRPNVISGIPELVGAADELTTATRDRTAALEWAGRVLGLVVVLAVALLAAARRQTDLRHRIGSGMRPVTVAGQWTAELLVPAAGGLVIGLPAARTAIAVLGPPGTLTSASLGPGAVLAVGAVLVGLGAAGLLFHLAAAAEVRPAGHTTSRRLGWLPLLAVAAATATAGLLTTDASRGAPAGLALLVPVLLTAAVGGLLSGAALRGLLWVGDRGGGAAGARSGRWRLVGWLAWRRVAAERRTTSVVTTVGSAGLGMLLFALCAVDSTRASVEDRVAVQSGAEAVAAIDGSAQIDPAAVVRPEPLPDGTFPPITGVRTPPTPRGMALGWSYQVLVPPAPEVQDLLVIDPTTFLAAASWGRGPELRAARAATRRLAASARAGGTGAGSAGSADGTAGAEPIPVLAVAAPGVAVGDQVVLDNDLWKAFARVADTLPAYPRLGARPMYVAAADALFAPLGPYDPRLKARAVGADPFTGPVQATLWSGRGPGPLSSYLAARQVQVSRLTTADQTRLQPEFVSAGRAAGYQQALGWVLGLLAVLALVLHADRSATRGRTTDFLLARLGLGLAGARGVRAAELVLLATLSLTGAVVSTALLLPMGARLLDAQPALPPAYRLDLTGPAMVLTATTAVLSALVASAVAGSRSRSGTEEVALRGGG